MQIIDGGMSQGVRKRKREQIRNRRVKAYYSNRNGRRSQRRLGRGIRRADILVRGQQSEIVRSVVLETEQLGKFHKRKGAEQKSCYNCKTKPAT